MKEFWNQIENKLISFQNFFVCYCITHYKSSQPFYVADGRTEDPTASTKIENCLTTIASDFRATHEEADDRIMYSVNVIFQHASSDAVTVVTSDTDIITVLLNHLNTIWAGKWVHVLKNGRIKSTKQQKELYPLHKILHELDSDVINALLAAHSLTGCNTVAKVGTKNGMLETLEVHNEPLKNFGKECLDEENILAAEKFLEKVVASKKYQHCSTFNELRVKLHRQFMVRKCVDLPCTLSALRENIKRAYLRARLWLIAPVGNIWEMLDPNDYGYQIDEFDNTIQPILF